ncbi:hypothetical protein NMG60_11014119 [Bertholletia excelsa]
MGTRLLLAVVLSLLASAAVGQKIWMNSHQQCRLDRLSARQPSQRIESEGGVTELWDEADDQFRCAGVAPMRNILQPNSLSLPKFHPSPRLIYIERGRGLLGVTIPGCAETFQSGQSSSRRFEGEVEQDQHQKVRRVRRGDIVAMLPGVAYWFFNDGNDELVTVSINDLNHQENQLDQRLRVYFLAGGIPRRGQKELDDASNGTAVGMLARRDEEEFEGQAFQNIIKGFDPELMAEAFNVSPELLRKMQEDDDRGIIVNTRGDLRMIRPDEEEEEEEERRWSSERGEPRSNGFEETLCSMKLRHNVDDRRSIDFYSRGSGRLHVVNRRKLPVLRFMDMSAVKGDLFPNTLFTLHWGMNSHSVVYVTRGEAEVQVADQDGRNLMTERVGEGSMFVIPQFFVATMRAGSQGVEWISFKTSSSPMDSPVVGYTSVIRAMPVQVISSAYRVSPSVASALKYGRGRESFMGPSRRS